MLTLSFMRTTLLMSDKQELSNIIGKKDMEELLGDNVADKQAFIENLMPEDEERTQKAEELNQALQEAISLQNNILQKSPEIEVRDDEDPAKSAFRVVNVRQLKDILGFENSATIMLNNYISQGRLDENSLSAGVTIKPPSNYSDAACALAFQRRWTQECAEKGISGKLELSSNELSIGADSVTIKRKTPNFAAASYECTILNRLAIKENRDALYEGDLKVEQLNVGDIGNQAQFKDKLESYNASAKKFKDQETKAKQATDGKEKVFYFANKDDRSEVLKHIKEDGKDFDSIIARTVFAPDPLNSKHDVESVIINDTMIQYDPTQQTERSITQDPDNIDSVKDVENISRKRHEDILGHYTLSDTSIEKRLDSAGIAKHRETQPVKSKFNGQVTNEINAARNTSDSIPEITYNKEPDAPAPKPQNAAGGGD